jgi:sugar fermentation stimulation protein A
MGLEFTAPLVAGRFLQREKRFLIHVALDGGERVVAHTNNTGSMRGCLAPDVPVWLSRADNPRRKLAWTLEIVRAPAPGAPLVGVNTQLANRLVHEALAAGLIPSLAGAAEIRSEVAYDDGGSRADFLVTGTGGARTWVEVKNVSLVEQGHALFPDAPTERGRKHLRALMRAVGTGDRAALVFCIQRGDARDVGPADAIDPAYGRLLRRAAAAGIDVYGLRNGVDLAAIAPEKLVPVVL